MRTGAVALGIDVGTSGVRLAALSGQGLVVAQAAVAMPPPRVSGGVVRQAPRAWRDALVAVFAKIAGDADLSGIRAVSLDATSGTLVATDSVGAPIGDALMYNDASGARFAEAIDAVAPAETAARGGLSGLARALFLQFARHPSRLLHQSDWLNGLLTGDFTLSDESNALKTGYDPVSRRWPDWIAATGLQMERLPTVVPCGEVMGRAASPFAGQLGLSPRTLVVAGCTDGCAAFLASGAAEPGDAVTSLGSTLTLKLLSDRPVYAPAMGVYSHRIGEVWLAGGASNAGGAAVSAVFSTGDLIRLDAAIDPSRDSGQDFYPMIGVGERFPRSEPLRQARMEPRPADDALYLQGLYESLARIERDGYAALVEAGATAPKRLFSLGGGTKSAAYRQIRQRVLALDFVEADEAAAAAGVARLALRRI